MGEAQSIDQDTGNVPCRLTRPYVGRIALMPHAAAGNLPEPPVSSPMAAAHIDAETATPEPLLEWPGIRSKSQGLRGFP